MKPCCKISSERFLHKISLLAAFLTIALTTALMWCFHGTRSALPLLSAWLLDNVTQTASVQHSHAPRVTLSHCARVSECDKPLAFILSSFHITRVLTCTDRPGDLLQNKHRPFYAIFERVLVESGQRLSVKGKNIFPNVLQMWNVIWSSNCLLRKGVARWREVSKELLKGASYISIEI